MKLEIRDQGPWYKIESLSIRKAPFVESWNDGTKILVSDKEEWLNVEPSSVVYVCYCGRWCLLQMCFVLCNGSFIWINFDKASSTNCRLY